MEETSPPGSLASLEGQRAGALNLERKQNKKWDHRAATSARTEGRLGYQEAPGGGRMVRFEDGPPARDGGRNTRSDEA